MKIDTYFQQQKCRPDCSFWRYKIYANIRGGSPGRGRQTTVGLSRTAIFSVFAAYFFGYFRDEARLASVITWRYAVHRRLFSDHKMHDLE